MSEPVNPLTASPAPPTGPQAPASSGQINWGDLMGQATGGFDPLPNSSYDVEVAEAEATTTTTDKTMFKVTLTVIDGPHANRRLWTNLTISPESPGALGIFFSQMAAFGMSKEYFETGPSPEAIAANLEGKRVKVTTIQKEWGGSMRNEVKTIKPLAAPGAGQIGGGLPGTPTSGPQASAGGPVAPNRPF